MKNLSDLLLAARLSANLTQQQLGDRLSVTRQTVSSWEKGCIPENAMPIVCGFIASQISEHEAAARDWRVKHDILEYDTRIKMTQLRSIVN